MQSSVRKHLITTLCVDLWPRRHSNIKFYAVRWHRRVKNASIFPENIIWQMLGTFVCIMGTNFLHFTCSVVAKWRDFDPFKLIPSLAQAGSSREEEKEEP